MRLIQPPRFAVQVCPPSRISPPPDDKQLHTAREPSSPEILNTECRQTEMTEQTLNKND